VNGKEERDNQKKPRFRLQIRERITLLGLGFRRIEQLTLVGEFTWYVLYSIGFAKCCKEEKYVHSIFTNLLLLWHFTLTGSKEGSKQASKVPLQCHGLASTQVNPSDISLTCQGV
jgi:hypothetical protein